MAMNLNEADIAQQQQSNKKAFVATTFIPNESQQYVRDRPESVRVSKYQNYVIIDLL